MSQVSERQDTLAEANGRQRRSTPAVWLEQIPMLVLLAAALACWPRAPLDAYDAPRLGLVALLLGLAQWRLAPLPRYGWSALLVAGGALLLTAAYAPEQSTLWFGSPQRGQGLLALLLCVLLFRWCCGLPARATIVVLRAAQIATSVVSVLALSQWLGIDPLRLDAPRPAAVSGNAVLLGQWLVLALPLCVCAARTSPRPLLAWGVVLIGVMVLLVSQTRGAWLGAGVALLLPWVWSAPERRDCWRRLLLLVGGAVVLLAAVVMVRPRSLEHRLQLWGAALQVLQAPPAALWPDGAHDRHAWLRPWIGYGADLQVMPMRVLSAKIPASTADPDRAHNLLLDLLLRYGLLGTLACGYAAYQLGRLLAHGVRAAEPFALAGVGALLGWAASLLSGFPGSADSLTAALVAGVAATGPGSRALTTAAIRPIRRLSTALLRGGLLLAAFTVWLLPPPWLADRWRAPEQALLRFDLAVRQLALARLAAAGSTVAACATGAAAMQQLEWAHQLDPTRPEYLQALQQSQRAWCSHCQANAQAQSRQCWPSDD